MWGIKIKTSPLAFATKTSFLRLLSVSIDSWAREHTEAENVARV